MKLSEYRKDADYYSSSASSINRNLSFSGIAIVWIFNQTEGPQIVLSTELLWALFFLAISLITDLIQYCVGFLLVNKFHRQQEKRAHEESGKIIEDDIDVLAPVSIKNTTITLFWLKISLNLIAYTFIVVFLLKHVFVK